jgi:hypothetical protein
VDIEEEPVTTLSMEQKVARAVKSLAAIPGITEALAGTLVGNGFHGLEDLLLAEVSDLSCIPEIGELAPAIVEAAKAEAQRLAIRVVQPAAA